MRSPGAATRARCTADDDKQHHDNDIVIVIVISPKSPARRFAEEEAWGATLRGVSSEPPSGEVSSANTIADYELRLCRAEDVRRGRAGALCRLLGPLQRVLRCRARRRRSPSIQTPQVHGSLSLRLRAHRHRSHHRQSARFAQIAEAPAPAAPQTAGHVLHEGISNSNCSPSLSRQTDQGQQDLV